MSSVSIEAVMDLGASYMDCLRTMNAAALRGIRFDIDDQLKPMLSLPPESLEVVIGMAQDFNRHECQERCKRSREKGTVFGRPLKELPDNFLVEAQKWADGMLNLREAARNCNMSPSTFHIHVEKAGIIPDRKARKNGRWPLPEKWHGLVQKLLREEITFEGAALRAELSVHAFKRRLNLYREDVRQMAPQHLLDACQAWAEKKCTLKKAALQAGYRQETFHALLKLLGYERGKLCVVNKKIFNSDNAQQSVSIHG